MSAEAQNTDKSIEKISLNLFRKHKVAISHKMKDSFPFFELLHDHDFITSEMYDVSKETFKKGHRIEEVVYKVLTEAQKKFKPSLLKILFDEFTLKRNPDLNHIYEIFKNEIPDKKFFSENDAQENEERPDTQSQFEQGPGENSYPSFPQNGPHPSDHNAPHDKELSEKLSEIEEIIAMETGITSNNNDALESQQANEQRAQQCDPAGAELHNHGIPVNSCPIVPVDIMKKTSFFSSGVEWEAQAKSGCNKESDIIEISSEDSMERRNREAFHPEASASALKRKSGIVDSENSSTSEKTKRKRKSGRHKEDNVDVKAEILPVTCGDMRGLLIKRKFEQGATRKCIRTEDGTWLTPREFEVRGGYEKASNWKTSLTCGGKTLKRLMEEEKVPTPPTTCGRNKKGGNSDKCKICLDGAKLFRCEKCQSFFHENCHLPPVDTKRNGWRCTFCTIDSLPRSQQRYRESEVLERQMEPEEKLKCAFLFLKVYSPLENDIFLKIPHENYVENASQCLERLRMLDKIRKSLNEGDYTKVKSFVQAIHPLFQDPKCNNSDLTEEEFKKNFKEVFAIQETN